MSGKQAILIGVGGGSSSGKTHVCETIMQQISNHVQSSSRVDVISMSSFYRKLTKENEEKAEEGSFNFDHPSAFDFDSMLNALNEIKCCKTVQLPIYDKVRNNPSDKSKEIALVDVLLVEGILVFYDERVRKLFDIKLFVDCDSDLRLARRVRTDIDKGRDLESILKNYTNNVKPAFEEFCLPTKKYADLIMPRGYENSVAVDIMVLHIRDYMEGKTATNSTSSSPPAIISKRNRSLNRHKSESSSKVSRPH